MKNGQFKKLIETLEKCDIEEKLKKELLHTLEDLQNHKKYGFVWNKEKTAEDVVLNCEKRVPVLESIKEKRINTNGNGNSEHNIFIEGDNYHALQVLQQTHKEKIDVIYIDPPYNTENKDFIYNDKKIDSQDGYRHSKWLSFMEKRLKLAKGLLKDSGVIFISIDDNEQARLKLLCDEIFGEENFIEMFIWTKTSTPPSLSNKTRKTSEYVLCYEKIRNNYKYFGEKLSGGDQPLLNTGNKERILMFPKEKVFFAFGDTFLQKGKYDKADLIDDLHIKDGYADKDFSLKAEFKWTQKKLDEEIKTGTKFIIKSNKISIRFIKEDNGGYKSPANFIRDDLISPVISKSDSDVDTNEGATKEMINIFGGKVFDNPKPVSLIKYLINFIQLKNINILDFFAGSGTTGHAVLELNKEDGGDRQFILCTNNENNNGNGHGGIAEGVCYPRIKKVIEGYKKNGDGEEVEGLGGGLEYFKTDFVDINVHALTDGDKLEISKKIGYILGIRHNCFKEKAFNEHYQILENKEENTFIYFEEDLSKFKEFKKHMEKKKGTMYSYAGGTKKRYGMDEEEFEDIQIEKIPEQFLAIYKNCIQ